MPRLKTVSRFHWPWQISLSPKTCTYGHDGDIGVPTSTNILALDCCTIWLLDAGNIPPMRSVCTRSDYIPRYLWDVITCPCPWYLLNFRCNTPHTVLVKVEYTLNIAITTAIQSVPPWSIWKATLEASTTFQHLVDMTKVRKINIPRPKFNQLWRC